jgi:hypothetical protein
MLIGWCVGPINISGYSTLVSPFFLPLFSITSLSRTPPPRPRSAPDHTTQTRPTPPRSRRARPWMAPPRPRLAHRGPPPRRHQGSSGALLARGCLLSGPSPSLHLAATFSFIRSSPPALVHSCICCSLLFLFVECILIPSKKGKNCAVMSRWPICVQMRGGIIRTTKDFRCGTKAK